MILLTQVLSESMIRNLQDGLLKRWLESVLPSVLSFFWSVVLAFVIAYIGAKVIRVLRRCAQKSMNRREVDEGAQHFIDQVLKCVLWICVFVIILGLFGFKASSLAAAVASIGVTAGLAFQGSLSNFAGGVLILVLHPFRVGDFIIEDTHGNSGTVEEISIFYTKLRTMDNRMVVIPNGTLANTSLTNVTESDRRRIDATFSISYQADIRRAKEILMSLVEKEERCIKEEDVLVFVRELDSSSVNLGVRFFVPTEQYWDVYWQLTEDVKYAFDEADISIPFPQMDVNIKQ